MAAQSNNDQFQLNLPIFKGHNYDRWCSQMKVIFIFQDVFEIVNDGVPILQENATEAQRTANRELRKKDAKGLFLIHQCIGPNIFLEDS